jgi:glycosyltransferase involved in cell wall biosynthesis
MQILYSIGATVGASGIGTTAYHGVRGIHRHGMLRRLLCGASRAADIPSDLVRTLGLVDRGMRKLAAYDRTLRLALLHTLLFDRWAARRLEPADCFLVWYKCGLRSMERAKAMGMLTVSQWGGIHPRRQYEELADEFARWGVRRRVPPFVLARSLAEIEGADLLLCASEHARQTFAAEGVPEAKLLTVVNGADPHRFRPARADAARPFRALFIGQVGFRKGVPYLLEAWRKLGWHDAELWLAGNVDREIRPLLARFSDLRGVRFLGYVPNPVATYQGADVFVLPSLQEGSAKVTFEAMACGLPLIATRESGTVARDGVEGVIVPPRDAAAVAATLDRLRSDAATRREMGRAARRRVESYSWDRHGDALVEVLRAVSERP